MPGQVGGPLAALELEPFAVEPLRLTLAGTELLTPTVYVNPAFTGPPGTDPDGPGPATAIGVDAFPTIQQALDAAAWGGSVEVALTLVTPGRANAIPPTTAAFLATSVSGGTTKVD